MYQNYQMKNTIPSNNMYYRYYVPTNQKYSNLSNQNDERLAGGFVFPFLLGGVTGAAVAPAFWNNNNNRPLYYTPYPPYPPYSYYTPRRWF